MGKYAEPSIDEHTAREHVERVFEAREELDVKNRYDAVKSSGQ